MCPRAIWYKFNFHLWYTTRRHIPEDYLFFYRYLLSFLLWTHPPTHCRCKWYFFALSHPVTHTHTHTQTHSVGLLWGRDRTFEETCVSATPAFTTDRLPCFRWHSNSQSQQARAADPCLRLILHERSKRGSWDASQNAWQCQPIFQTRKCIKTRVRI